MTENEAKLQAECDRLRSLIEYDRTGLAAALVRVRGIAAGYSWLAVGEWGSYEYHERTEENLRREIGDCLAAIDDAAAKALAESGCNAVAAFRPDTIRSLREEVARLRAESEGRP